jgi:hypothetical protein
MGLGRPGYPIHGYLQLTLYDPCQYLTGPVSLCTK